MAKTKEKTGRVNIDSLINLIETLRGENGCPWDKKQTPQSMSVYLVEEIYELLEAFETEDTANVCEEIGDVFFHILFLISIYHEKRSFNIEDVINKIINKMIRRHPHVFGDSNVNNADDVKKQWHEIKLEEKKDDNDRSILDTVPSNLPALMRAYRVSERASKEGLDWQNLSGVMEKLEEELSELKTALAEKNKDQIAAEYGDVLFTMANVARFLNIHPETALKGSIRRFEERFKDMTQLISDKGKSLASMSQEEIDFVWDETKRKVG